MLYTVDKVNEMNIIPGVRLGARIKDDCDRDIYGLEQSVDFIRGKRFVTYIKDCLRLWYSLKHRTQSFNAFY